MVVCLLNLLLLLYFQINELANKNRGVWLFLFPIILFDTTGTSHLTSTAIEEHQLKFMHNLENYFLFQSRGDHTKASKMLEGAMEIICCLLQL